MRISDWSSDVCSSDLVGFHRPETGGLNMSQSMATKGKIAADPHSAEAFATDWASDREVFKGVPWGKAMMWIFLLSDTFIFSSFLVSYMTVRSSTTVPWPKIGRASGRERVGQ